MREFALGIEGLRRFTDHEPLRRVHECVFAGLALESEPVDPRLSNRHPRRTIPDSPQATTSAAAAKRDGRR